MTGPEPWLRGPLPGIHPLVQPLFFSFAQVREDLAKHTTGLPPDAVWRQVGPLPALGFQLRHIAGSVDRLMTYLMDRPLSDAQMTALRAEAEPSASLEDLLAAVDASLNEAEQRLRAIDPATIHDARFIGRKRLPTTVLGLLVHIAEHTQRHLGQAITTAKLGREPQS
ncbi:MAG: DinB family protein [Bryobacterales bacterium]|nr:DinB family protein [Bryobacterales bacterium]